MLSIAACNPIICCQSQSLYYAEQIDRCALLVITVFRTTATRFYAYLVYPTHVPYIMMAVHQTPFNRSCVFFKFSYIENIFQFSIKFTDTLTCNYLSPSITCTIIFTFSIIPYLILFVKHYFLYIDNQ